MIYLVTKNRELFDNDLYKIISVEESLKILNSLTIVGLDTETTGLDPWTCQLKSIQLGNKEFQVIVDTTTIDPKKYKDFIESDKLFIGWNLKFDLKFLFKYGIIPKDLWDGYLMEKLLYLGYPPGVHSLSLKSAGINYLDIELDKSVRGKIIYAGLTDDVILYSANDVKYLEDIRDKQIKLLKEQNLLIAATYENRFVLPLSYCEYCGIKIDKDKWQAKMAKDNRRLQVALDACNNWLLANEPDSQYIYIDRQGSLFSDMPFNLEPQVTLNWNSAKQLIPLFKKYGVDVAVEDKSKGGLKDSIDSKSLKPQKDKCSLIPLYLEYKEAIKVTSTYGENFLKQINPKSGRIHTNYQQLGADTTRLTSGGKDKSQKIEYINLLNLPANEETRACFVAEEGNKWISIDYSGQESFIMGDMSNDKKILNELNYGDKDLHTLTAKIVFNYIPKDMPAKEVKKKFHKERQLSKGYEFAFNYAGNASTIKRNFGLTDEEANRIYNSYMGGFEGLKKYQDFRRKDWLDKGYILLNPLTGHKVHIYDFESLKEDQKWLKTLDWDYYREMKKSDPNCYTVQRVKNFFKKRSTWDRKSINFPIQATGSMCLRVSLINFFEYLRKNNLLFKVLICVTPYDEINCEAPNNIANNIAEVLYNCMVKAGAYFCTKCKLDAEISYINNNELPNHWVH